MKKYLSLLFPSLAFFLTTTLIAQSTFINEVNYLASDPAGRGLEIAGQAGQNLDGWSVVIYQVTGMVTSVESLGGQVIPSQQNGYGAVWYEMEQMSGNEGIALVNPAGAAVQFIGVGSAALSGITATQGPAQGMTSQYAGTQLLPGHSLQLTGIGLQYLDFLWAIPLGTTPGGVNTNQLFGLLRPLTGLKSGAAHGDELWQQQPAPPVDVRAFPNPATDYIRIQRQAGNGAAGALTIYLMDVEGRMLQRSVLGAADDYRDILLSDLAAGHYYLRVGEGPTAAVHKIVKQ